jgi:3-deoxy-7-phosphoheptulonate synthase
MLIVMSPNATPEQVEVVCDRIKEIGFTPHQMPGTQRLAIGITGNTGPIDPDLFTHIAGIEACIPVSKPYKLVSREVKPEDTVITFDNGVRIGERQPFAVMAGPCSVESREQILEVADAAAQAGAKFLRGGAFKPRTSPYVFQGLKEEGLKLLAEARERTGLLVVTEVKDTETLPMVTEYTDILQIGARNMQNFSLLEAVGETTKPVLLKRGMSATLQELFMAAEYIMSRGNYQVILCERGIRTFETMTRNTLDLGAVAMMKQHTHLPVIIDPSHGIGIWSGVIPLARAAAAVGADGLMIEVHPKPERALSDGPQSLTLKNFRRLMEEVRRVAAAVGREM